MKQASASFHKTADMIPNADHHQVCKYENSLSQGFDMVVKRLQILQQALNSGTGMHSGQPLGGENSFSEAAHSALAQQESKDGTNNT